MAEFEGFDAGVPAWADLSTNDPSGAMRFYEALFGWDLEQGPAETMGYTMCRLRGRPVAAINGQAVEHIPPTWVTYIASDDVTATAERITAAGGRVFMGPMQVMDQGSVLVAADPQGAMFGAWQSAAHRGFGVANEPGTVIWSELATRDLASATEFYTKVFGWTWEVADTGGGPTYQMFKVDGRPVGGAMQIGEGFPAEAPPSWEVYFGVEDTDAALDRVRELGGEVLKPAVDSSFGRWAVVADPQGATTILVSTTAAAPAE